MLCTCETQGTLQGTRSGLQELGPRARPATLLRLSVIFIICLVFSSE